MKQLSIILVLCALVLTFTMIETGRNVTFAQGTPKGSKDKLAPAPTFPKGFTDALEIGGLVRVAAAILIPLAVGIAVFRIIVGGYHIMMSQGNEQELAEAKETLTSAIIGLIFAIAGLSVLGILVNALLSG